MRFKIGFTAETTNENTAPAVPATVKTTAEPKKSVVQVHFPTRGLTCAYYNDMFDLHKGDLVYVEGKLEGLRGRVVEVAYTFKIKLSDYKRVIGKADTDVNGAFYPAGSHFVTHDADALPFKQAVTWFRAPEKPEDEYVSAADDTSFRLEELSGMRVSRAVADRGHDYYMQNRVVYLELYAGHGKAIVEGSTYYIVEFEYQQGEIRNLTCDCFCSGGCKHGFAAMLQLKETLDLMAENDRHLSEADYVAAIGKSVFFEFAVDGKTKGSFIIGK